MRRRVIGLGCQNSFEFCLCLVVIPEASADTPSCQCAIDIDLLRRGGNQSNRREHNKKLHQINFSAICIILGSPALRILPNALEDTFVTGLPKFT